MIVNLDQADYIKLMMIFLTHENPHLALSEQAREDAGDGQTHVEDEDDRLQPEESDQ
jgi:hypothetical protein